MTNSQINANYLSMPLNWNEYKEKKWTVATEEIEQLVRNTTEGIIFTSKDKAWKFPFQAVKKNN